MALTDNQGRTLGREVDAHASLGEDERDGHKPLDVRHDLNTPDITGERLGGDERIQAENLSSMEHPYPDFSETAYHDFPSDPNRH